MSLAQQIKGDFLTAFKDKQDTKVSVLRMLKAALTNKEIEKKLAKDTDLSDEDILLVIGIEIKKRKDSYASYKDAGRDDLAGQEEKELKILEEYMPEQMSEEEVREIITSAVKETGASSQADFGKVMGVAMGKLKGKADGQLVSKVVKVELSK